MASRTSLRSAAARLVHPARPAPAPPREIAPPPCPPGWTTGPPDFVGVGSQRCGTSWWFDMMSTHPGVARAPGSPKEAHFFDRLCESGATATIASEYHRYFPRPAGRLVGEWTPRYLHDFWVAPLLAQTAPDARFLVLVRDPVERFWSGLAHERSKPVPPDPLFLYSDAFARGLYHLQLERFLHSIDAARVLVLQYERCAADPEQELRRTFDFLRLDPPEALPAFARRVNESPPGAGELPARLRRDLAEAYADDTRRLAHLVPAIDTGLWLNMKGLV
ncbi:MAG TPA: sulfotransferase [Acidimicrobiales bacterium]|nr:sulfotransferase [Acidimicrobiales bacterium]